MARFLTTIIGALGALMFSSYQENTLFRTFSCVYESSDLVKLATAGGTTLRTQLEMTASRGTG
jgi:hypothetical protein